MEELLRDEYINRQDLNRGPSTGLFFYDRDGKRVDEVTLKEANAIASNNPSQLFYLEEKNGEIKELTIDQVNSIFTETTSTNSLTFDANCDNSPQACGPPFLSIFGGGGIGAIINPVISPISSSVIAFDIINPGKNYFTEPFAQLVDSCGNGSGSSLKVEMESYVGIGTTSAPNTIGIGTTNVGSGLKIRRIIVKSPGDKYLSSPDGSFGGGGRVVKRRNQGLILRKDGSYKVIPPNDVPDLNPGDRFIPPVTDAVAVTPTIPGAPATVTPTTPGVPGAPTIPGVGISPTYPVILEIDDVDIINPGFGYRPGDKIIVTPDRGAVLEPVIDNGRIIKVNVISPGVGFDDFPEITTDSATGYNFSSRPIFKVRRLNEEESFNLPKDATIISVVDCVGKVI